MTSISGSTAIDTVINKPQSDIDRDLELLDVEKHTPCLTGKTFLDRPKAISFDFNIMRPEFAALISNKLITEVYNCKLLGLALPQIGVNYRVIAIAGQETAMFNPIVVGSGKIETYEHVCPSFPGAKVKVQRHAIANVKYLDPFGKFQKKEFHGLSARIIADLYDIVSGGSLLDHASGIKRKKILDKIEQMRLK